MVRRLGNLQTHFLQRHYPFDNLRLVAIGFSTGAILALTIALWQEISIGFRLFFSGASVFSFWACWELFTVSIKKENNDANNAEGYATNNPRQTVTPEPSNKCHNNSTKGESQADPSHSSLPPIQRL